MFFDFFLQSKYIGACGETSCRRWSGSRRSEPDCEAAEEIRSGLQPPPLTAKRWNEAPACLAREGDTDIAGRCCCSSGRSTVIPATSSPASSTGCSSWPGRGTSATCWGRCRPSPRGSAACRWGLSAPTTGAACGRTAPPTPSTLSTWPALVDQDFDAARPWLEGQARASDGYHPHPLAGGSGFPRLVVEEQDPLDLTRPLGAQTRSQRFATTGR